MVSTTVFPTMFQERIASALEWKAPDAKDVGPCGGFSNQYNCMCDYFGLPFREVGCYIILRFSFYRITTIKDTKLGVGFVKKCKN